jgi:hypothetical protein
MREPHKHADLIKMWADGWEIEEYDESWGKWVIQTSPSWSRYKDYRRRKGDTIETFCVKRDNKLGVVDVYGEGQSNLKLTFDGHTGELKHAEKI